MNRYPSWVYATVIVAVVLGLLYTIPNFFGEAPAVQVSSARPTLKVDSATLSRVEEALKNARIPIAGTVVDSSGIRVRFDSVETQAKARDALTAALNPKKDAEDYIIALNLMSQSPSWLRSLGAAHVSGLGFAWRRSLFV